MKVKFIKVKPPLSILMVKSTQKQKPSTSFTAAAIARARTMRTVQFAYIVIFLRNGGERLRAVWLASKSLCISIPDAARWVDSVKLDGHKVSMEEARRLQAEYPTENVAEDLKDYKEWTVSHWPGEEV